jgi:hypothetical protein
LFHPIEKLLAIRTSNSNNMNAIQWSRIKNNKLQPVTISCTAFSSVLYELMGWRKEWRLKLMAVCLVKNDENILLFDLHDTEYRTFIKGIEPVSVDEKQKKRRDVITLHPAEWRDNFGSGIPEHAVSCRCHRAMFYDHWQIDAPGLPVRGFEGSMDTYSTLDVQQQIDALKVTET